MREKNVRRAAKALWLQQADDKNEILCRQLYGETRKIVADQGRALIILEKIALPFGKEDYTEEEMFELLLKKLMKKGHRIQNDTEPDDEKRAAEKKEALQRRWEQVYGEGSVRPEDQELVDKTVAQQEAKIKTYDILKENGRPIPGDLRAEIEGRQKSALVCPCCNRTYGIITLIKNWRKRRKEKKLSVTQR
jgi:hypothetical protein